MEEILKDWKERLASINSMIKLKKGASYTDTSYSALRGRAYELEGCIAQLEEEIKKQKR